MVENDKVTNKEIIIPTNEMFTEHQRDPSIYFNKDDGLYYIFLGVQSKEKKAVWLYTGQKIWINGNT